MLRYMYKINAAGFRVGPDGLLWKWVSVFSTFDRFVIGLLLVYQLLNMFPDARKNLEGIGHLTAASAASRWSTDLRSFLATSLSTKIHYQCHDNCDDCYYIIGRWSCSMFYTKYIRTVLRKKYETKVVLILLSGIILFQNESTTNSTRRH